MAVVKFFLLGALKVIIWKFCFHLTKENERNSLVERIGFGIRRSGFKFQFSSYCMCEIWVSYFSLSEFLLPYLVKW